MKGDGTPLPWEGCFREPSKRDSWAPLPPTTLPSRADRSADTRDMAGSDRPRTFLASVETASLSFGGGLDWLGF